MPLDRFSTYLQITPTNRHSTTDLYAQAWALFEFFMQKKPAQLRDYLGELSRTKPGFRENSSLKNEFVRHFGIPGLLEPEWQQFIDKLHQNPSP
jgi:hypothetical protein